VKKKIVAFGASSSRNSINKEFSYFAAKQIDNVVINLIDLNDFEMPIFSIDSEKKHGIPKLAYEFKLNLKKSDGIIISFAEHNGAYTAAFKNIFDWISRIEEIVWYNKPMFLLSTSDGSRGGLSVLQIAYNRISRGNPNIIPRFSLPNFYENFNTKTGITDSSLKKEFDKSIKIFRKNIK
jgi:NAD(P)H-dependent FMN reductase